MSKFYKTLLGLCKNNQAIIEGETFNLPSDNDDSLMAFMRKNGEDAVLVLLNLSEKTD